MRLKKLTDEQVALMPQVLDEWLKICLDTTPVDRAKVRNILERLYALAKKPAPKNIVHLGSPLQIAKQISKMQSIGNEADFKQNQSGVWEVSYAVRNRFAPKPFAPDLNIKINGKVQNGWGFMNPVRNRILREITLPFSRQCSQVHGLVLDAIVAHKIMGWYRDAPFEFGQCDTLLPECDCCGRLGFDVSKLEPSFDLAKNCGWSVLSWDWAFISDKPEFIKLDEQSRLHCETGPALRYPDGFSIFAIHGVPVPERVVVSPESITIPEIESENNAEVRRVMIERYGQEQFLLDSGAVEVHRDDFGVLYRNKLSRDENLMIVKVVNSTPEPDGSYKDYFLRVPPSMERARQAVAWTFGKEEREYSPALQT